MYLLNITQDFQCDFSNVFFNEILEGFEVHPNSFELFQSHLNNMFSSGGVEFRVIPQSIDYCLHCHINTIFFLDLLQISNIIFFSKYVLISSFVHLMVDHVIRVAIIGGCDQPITTCISLGPAPYLVHPLLVCSMFLL